MYHLQFFKALIVKRVPIGCLKRLEADELIAVARTAAVEIPVAFEAVLASHFLRIVLLGRRFY